MLPLNKRIRRTFCKKPATHWLVVTPLERVRFSSKAARPARVNLTNQLRPNCNTLNLSLLIASKDPESLKTPRKHSMHWVRALAGKLKRQNRELPQYV
jgi:hypothetical protein